jgi:hypothetical protein
MAVIANPGDLRRVRALKRRSCRKLGMKASVVLVGMEHIMGQRIGNRQLGIGIREQGIVFGSGRGCSGMNKGRSQQRLKGRTLQ